VNDIRLWFDIFGLMLAAVIIVVGLSIAYRRSIVIKRIFGSQALKRSGSVSGGYRRYILTFTHRDHLIAVSIYSGSKYEAAYTRVVTKVQKSELPHMKIYSETIASEIGKKLGMQDIQIGRSEFDEKFMIKGSDEFFVRNLLTSNIQDKLLTLRSLKPVITLDDNGLVVNVPRVLKTEEAYDLLIDSALVIIDRLSEI
jgi:hypothetical protein